jgi:hypothetical protein
MGGLTLAAKPEAIALVSKLLALKLGTPDLALLYLGCDTEALALAQRIAEREPASLEGAPPAQITTIAKNALLLGLTDAAQLAIALADHPQGPDIAETAITLAHAESLAMPGTNYDLRGTGVTKGRAERRLMDPRSDEDVMREMAAANGVKLDAELRPISSAACTAGRHVFGEPDHRGWRVCAACGVTNVIDARNRLARPTQTTTVRP